jgi:hypothetical protein
MLEGDVVENRWSPNQLVQHEGRFARITTEADQGKVGIKYIGEEKTNLVTEAELQEADESLLQEDEGAAMGGGETTTPSAVETIPYAAGINPDGEVSASMNVYDFTPEDFNIDLKDLFLSQDQAETPAAAAPDEEIEVGDDLDLDLAADTDEEATEEAPETPEEPEAAGEDTDVLFEELINALAEELTVDMGETKQGYITTDEQSLKYEQEMEMAAAEDSEKKEEDEELVKAREKADKLDETVRKQTVQIKDLLTIVDELNSSLNETLLSNAKLLYCNKTLSDASLNERQKSKIVEAIAQANTPDEAKTLQETLKATVGTTKKAGPKSLSESVNRKSNLSGIMPRRKQPEQFTFADQMKKLAGIK